MQEGRWEIGPVDWQAVGVLREALGVSDVTATVLVRRGLAAPAAARSFLDAAMPDHDPLLLGDMAGAVELIRSVIDRGARICVHGDHRADQHPAIPRHGLRLA